MAKLKTTGFIHPTLNGYQFADGIDKPLTPLTAIRKKCLECVCGSAAAVQQCNITDCPLWPWRMGKRPTDDTLKDSRTPQEKEASECHS
jgi:hypothetical protein